MYIGLAALARQLFHLLTEVLMTARLIEFIPLEQCLDIEAGASGQYRYLATTVQLIDLLRGQIYEIRDRELLIRIAYIDEVMRYAAPLLEGRLGRADIEPPVYKLRISGYDLGMKSLSQVERQCRLAHRGRSEYDDEPAARHRCSHDPVQSTLGPAEKVLALYERHQSSRLLPGLRIWTSDCVWASVTSLK